MIISFPKVSQISGKSYSLRPWVHETGAGVTRTATLPEGWVTAKSLHYQQRLTLALQFWFTYLFQDLYICTSYLQRQFLFLLAPKSP